MELIELVDIEMNALAERIKGNIKNNVSGKTTNSFRVETTENESTLFGNKWIETGRKPGKMPPVNNLLLWVESKFNPAGQMKNIEGIAFAVARKIGLEGTKLYQQGGRKDIFTNEINEFLKEIAPKLKHVIVTKIGVTLDADNK